MEPRNNEDMLRELEKDIENWEGQEVEFIDDFPSNTHELAKEMTAFSTSNNGRIYLGIDKNKKKIGLSSIRGIGDTDGKDKVLNRLAGITKNSIKPPIVVKPYFIDIKDKDIVILRIDVPKGIEPIYFSSNKPYIRILTISDVATPDQIKELHRKYSPKTLTKIDNYGKFNPTNRKIIEKDKYSPLERFSARILSYGNNTVTVELFIPDFYREKVIFGSGAYYILPGIEGEYIMEVNSLSENRVELLIGPYVPFSTEDI